MADARELIFPCFPILVGNPKSFIINNREDLNRFALINSNTNDKNFGSICSYDNENNPIISSVFFETDLIDPNPVRKVVHWFEEHKIPWICLLSGGRGFHLHGLLKSEKINHRTVKNFANMILEETDVKNLFDSHVSGVLEKLCRIPNTQRLNNGWCVPITRSELFTINNPEEFKKICSSPRFIDFEIGERPSIYNFIEEDDSIDKPIQIIETAPHKDIFILKQILRPCVYKAITTPNPSHIMRIDATIEALTHGITPKQLTDTYSKLNWIDFSHSVTRYQIDFIDEKRRRGELRVFGKKKLGCEKKGSCLKCIFNST